MSAFLVSDKHINTLATFALTANLAYYYNNALSVCRFPDDAQRLAATLYGTNCAAMDARYGDRWRGDEPPAKSFTFARIGTGSMPPALAILRACACYDYQACEVADYGATEAAAIINAIRAAAVRGLPGWDAAPWEID